MTDVWTKWAQPFAGGLLFLVSGLCACSNEAIRGTSPQSVSRLDGRRNLAREELLKTHAQALESSQARAAAAAQAEAAGAAAAPLPSLLHFAPDVDLGELLPFGIRLQKVTWVTGAPPAATDALTRGRFLLGDYDYAAGIQEQKAWTESQMRLWLESLLPSCESGEFAAKFPWPAKGTEFVTTAMGRPATPEDTRVLADIQAMPISDADKRTLACLTFLTSLEFLTR